MYMFNVTLCFSVFRSSSISISIASLDSFILPSLAPAVIYSSKFASTATTITSGFAEYFGDPVKLPSNSSIILFRSKYLCNIMFSVLNGLSNEAFYHLDQYIISLNNFNKFFF